MKIYLVTSETPLTKSRQRETASRLLDDALLGEFGVRRPEIISDGRGKPRFKDSDIFFSVSHCKFGVGCVVSKRETGVDVECFRKVSPALVKRVCHRENEIPAVKSDADFLRMWVQKEAFAKFTGGGFAEGFSGIDTTKFPASRVFEYGGLFIACYYEGDEACELFDAGSQGF
ncbi:MAG: 4'-phosphopantetheinyl transferase superfamily protein [Oscillospiraceae bacterium]|nr:4'-phosphopantetheinyl transferase superfamily protein [Oscillospiraceae bacterium]